MRGLVPLLATMLIASSSVGASAFQEQDVRYVDQDLNKDVDQGDRYNAAPLPYRAEADEIFCGYHFMPHPQRGYNIDNAAVEVFDISQAGMSLGGGAGMKNYPGHLWISARARFVKKSALGLSGSAILTDAAWSRACEDKSWTIKHSKIDHLRGPNPEFTGCDHNLSYNKGQFTGMICWN